MEKEHLHYPDWRSEPPMGLYETNSKLKDVRKKLEEGTIIPEQALEGASFAFNTDTNRGNIPLSPHVIHAGYINKFQEGAKTFELITDKMDNEGRISFMPASAESNNSDYDRHDILIKDYAALLSQNAQDRITENFVSFSGSESVLSDWQRPPDYEKDSVALSAMLFREQWNAQKLNTISIQEMPEKEFPIDTNQIIALSEAQLALSSVSSSDYTMNKSQKKVALEVILETLRSPELSASELNNLPAATTIKLLAEARTLHDLGELSEDGNPDDFARNRVGYSKLAIKKLREAELSIDQAANTLPVPGLETIRNKIRYYHDNFSGEIGQERVVFSGKKLSDLTTFDINEFSVDIPPKSSPRHLVAVRAILAAETADRAKAAQLNCGVLPSQQPTIS